MRRARVLWLTPLFACAVSVACGDAGSSSLTRSGSGTAGMVGAGGISFGGAATGGGRALACQSDKECTPIGLLCDPVALQCVACIKSSDCSVGATCRGGLCDAKIACTNSRQCVSAPAGRLICDQSIGDCVQCVSALDCSPGQSCTGNVCGSATGGGGAAGAGGFVGTGGSFAGSGGAGAFAGAAGSSGFGGAIDTGGIPGDGGFGGANGGGGAIGETGGAIGGNGGAGGGFGGAGGIAGASGAWGPCFANTDCTDQRICTYSTQQVLSIGGVGACVKSCSGSTATCDPPLPGAAPTVCVTSFCGIPCGAGYSCPTGFSCNVPFGYCFPSQ